jgi:hypothetical protein
MEEHMYNEIIEVDIENKNIKEDKEYYNKYLHARPLNIYRTSTATEVNDAVNYLLEDIGYTSTKANRALINMRMLVCDLYHNYIGSKKRYLRLNMSKTGGRDTIPRRYNPQGIGYESLRCCMLGLIKGRYIIRKKGYFNNSFKDGYQTRIRVRKKLIDLLKQFGVTGEMISLHPERELILMRSEPIDKNISFKGKDGRTRRYPVKVKKLVGYDKYEDHTKRWRNTLRAYNELLDRTYIDVDMRRYKDPGDISIDLSDKANTRRAFTHESFHLGGRFYGGFWQSMPEELRERIIINANYVNEIDYSGMMVHVLYAMKGMKLSTYNLKPYLIDSEEKPSKRDVYKKLLVVAANIELDEKKKKPEESIIYAVKSHIKKNPKKYPPMPNSDRAIKTYLRKCFKEVKEYHYRIADLLGKGEGLKTQFIDSEIAYKIISRMTKLNVPILTVHDSFICKRSDKTTVYEVIVDAYVAEINSMMARKGISTRVEPDEVKTSISEIESHLPGYMTDSINDILLMAHPIIGNTKQMKRQAVFLKKGKTNFNVTITDCS